MVFFVFIILATTLFAGCTRGDALPKPKLPRQETNTIYYFDYGVPAGWVVNANDDSTYIAMDPDTGLRTIVSIYPSEYENSTTPDVSITVYRNDNLPIVADANAGMAIITKMWEDKGLTDFSQSAFDSKYIEGRIPEQYRFVHYTYTRSDGTAMAGDYYVLIAGMNYFMIVYEATNSSDGGKSLYETNLQNFNDFLYDFIRRDAKDTDTD
jgi:hypothetical protein